MYNTKQCNELKYSTVYSTEQYIGCCAFQQNQELYNAVVHNTHVAQQCSVHPRGGGNQAWNIALLSTGGGDQEINNAVPYDTVVHNMHLSVAQHRGGDQEKCSSVVHTQFNVGGWQPRSNQYIAVQFKLGGVATKIGA